MHIDVRAYGDLVDLVGARELRLPFGDPRSVKDLVESAGIPHPEVGLLLVDGEPVGFGHLLEGGERVAAYPPFHGLRLEAGQDLWPAPPEPRRFVLDVHLGTLARRLRLLGFDAWYRSDADDRELADVAVADERILLSRDRQLLMRRKIVHGYGPRADDPAEQLREVVRRYALADRQAPLTRCVPCNGALVPVSKEDVVEQLPPRTREGFDRFARCRGCGQVFWSGAHAEALEAIIAGAGRASPERVGRRDEGAGSEPALALVDSGLPTQGTRVTVSEAPDATCQVVGCEEPAGVSVPAPTAHELVDAPAAETVPLCNRHAAHADGREASPEPRDP